MDNVVGTASDALRVVEEAGIWSEFIETMALDIQDQLDMMGSEADRAVFWTLCTRAIAEKASSDTAVNILEYLLGVTDLNDYIADFMREYYEGDATPMES